MIHVYNGIPQRIKDNLARMKYCSGENYTKNKLEACTKGRVPIKEAYTHDYNAK